MPLIEPPGGRTKTTDKKLISKYTRRMQYRTFVRVFDSNIILLQLGVPRIGSVHPEDLSARCISVGATQTESPLVWDVVAQYTTEFPNPKRDKQNPLEEPPLLTYSHTTVAITKFFDRNGKPFVNTAAQRLLSPPTISETIQVLTIKQQQADFDRKIGLSYTDAINAGPWFGYKARHVRSSVSASEGWKNGVTFWIVNYRFEIRAKEPWNPVRVLNQGIMVYNAVAKKWQLLEDANGVLHGQEVILNEAGNDVETKENVAAGNVHWLDFEVYDELDFNGLIQI